jgi:hypothetical protein
MCAIRSLILLGSCPHRSSSLGIASLLSLDLCYADVAQQSRFVHVIA